MAILTHHWWESKITEPLSDKVKHISHRSKPFHSKALPQEKWKYLSTDLYVDFRAHSLVIVIKCQQFKSPSTVNEQQEILVYLHNRPLLRTKTINYWYTQQPRWISKDLVSVKKDTKDKALCDSTHSKTLQGEKHISGCQELETEGKETVLLIKT